jgi:hypothetical protein
VQNIVIWHEMLGRSADEISVEVFVEDLRQNTPSKIISIRGYRNINYCGILKLIKILIY